MQISDIKKIPKAELHVHLEGTITPSLARQLTQKNGADCPEDLFTADDTITWQDFSDFIRVYDLVSECIKSADDLRLVTYDYLLRSHSEGCIYVELTVSPLHAQKAGLSYEQAMEAVIAGITQANQDCGIEARILTVLVRHTGEKECMNILDKVLAHPSPYIVGIGLAGDERTHPAKLFREHYKKAEKSGLKLTAHAGEWGGAQQVFEAIDSLNISRVGHGVQVIEDPSVLELVIEKNIHLEVCPMSNIALNVFPDYVHHPLKIFIEQGINLSLNSDDPPFFATSIGNEYLQAAKHLQLDENALRKITRNAVQSSFADDALKNSLLKNI